MRVIDYIEALAEAGHLTQLCQAGLVSVLAYHQREIFNVYHALAQLPTYQDSPRLLAEETARTSRVHLGTVYRALKAMGKPLALPVGPMPFAKVRE